MYIKFFWEISKNDADKAGGKGASLGEITQAGIPVPPGFVITTESYRQFSSSELSEEFKQIVFSAFDKLGAERVAVRSSAVAEDSSGASWAGQLESFLNVTKEGLIEAIKGCWDSIKSERALSYGSEKNLSEAQLMVAVVVQKMVSSEAAGVIFTVNPVTKDRTELMIEAGFGLGEMLVQGMITPDNYLLDKETLDIKEKSPNRQDAMLTLVDGKNKEIPVPEEKKGQIILSDEQIKELAKLAIQIEDHYGFPCDIEWAFENDTFYIVQSRPITSL